MMTAQSPPIEVGMVCFCDEVRSLDNKRERKARTVLVIHKHGSTLMGVGVTGTPSEEKLQSSLIVRLPDHERFPSFDYGIDRTSWAVPQWLIFPLSPCRIVRVPARPIPSEYVERVWEVIQQIRPPRLSLQCHPAAERGAMGHACAYCTA